MAQEFGAVQMDVVSAGHEVSLSGRLDARSAAAVRAVLEAAVDDGTGDLLVHVGELEIWDGTGLGVLIGAHRRSRRRGRRLVLTDVPPRQLRLLRATRLSQVLTVQPLAVA
jgi:anti-anti-sigma factor